MNSVLLHIFLDSSYIPWDESGAEGLPTGSSDCFEIAINLTATAICVTPGIDLPNFGDDGSALSPSLVANEPGLEFTPKSELQSDQETPELGFDSRRRRAPATESDVVGRERRRNRAKLGRTKRQSFAEDGLGFCKDGKVLVKSRHCNDRLPFVCVKPALEKSTVTLGPCKYRTAAMLDDKSTPSVFVLASRSVAMVNEKSTLIQS